MDPNNMGTDGGQMNAGSMQQSQQGQNTGAPGNQNNFMTSLMGQLSRMQQGGAQGGLGGSQQVPLLVGASPLQQQLSALQGLTGGQTGGAQAGMAGGDQQGQQAGGDQQGQQNQALQQSLFFGGGAQGQNQGLAQQGQQQQGQAQQQQGQMQNPLGMMGQNPLLGGGLGFNMQQLQQLQLAQQLMAAGLPPQLAFGGQQLMGGAGAGLGLGQTPQLAGLASNPAAASLGLAAPNATGAAMGGQAATPNIPSSNAGANTLTAAEPAASKPSGGGSVGEGQDWAEPFSGKGKKEPPFPLKLHQILSNPEFQECICWNPHGRSWRILKPPVFEQLVIPLYFRHAKYASFMRQVNGWGFKRIVSGNDHNSYYHELFLRDYPQLCLKMKRIRKGDKVSEAIDEKDENEKSNEGGEANEEAGNSDNNQEGGSEGKEESEGEGNDEQTSSAEAAKATGSNDAGPSSGTGGDISNQSQGVNNANLSALSGMAAQFQNQQAPAPAAGGIGGLDQSALLKLQEALQGGAAGANLLQQQQQQPNQQAMPFGINGLNMGNLGNLGGALAAQLQQATQPQQNNDAGANSSGGGNALQEVVAQLQQQQQNNQQSEGESV